MRTGPVTQSRPLFTDDIQKAKMRALFMQSKYKKSASLKENKEAKISSPSKSLTNQGSIAGFYEKYMNSEAVIVKNCLKSVICHVMNFLKFIYFLSLCRYCY